MKDSLRDIRLLDDLARRQNPINKLHPLVKLLTTIIYLAVVVSFGRYEISALLPLIFYPVVVFALAELAPGRILRRIAWVMPLVIGIGIFNPVFDHQTVTIMNSTISKGWLSFISLVIKCVLTVAAGILLVATTGMEKLGAAMRIIGVPKIMVLQLLLTYRYILLLGDELARMLRAYSLRAPGHRGIKLAAWGSFAGSLLLRSFDRAQRVYAAMCLRGFKGDYNTGDDAKVGVRDLQFLIGWVAFFLITRSYNLPFLLGSFLTGVIGQ
ncbi:MAG: cobalt ECF transporter T component CbiQ [Syntrophomonadaceae bacterium]|nr:cobalt ECF transporter T component CbiQ [Syntrophomonadaceae bacterium]